ncbi:Ms5788A family Cys-rich leader peptide [Planosporangium flavigriseum]
MVFAMLRSLTMGTLLTKRRTVDLCRVAACLCCLA